jgi:hypothetical protein
VSRLGTEYSLISGGAKGAIAPGRHRNGAPKSRPQLCGSSQGATNTTFAPGRQKPWRRHCQWRREGGQGAIAPGRQREGAPKEGGENFFLMMNE